MPRANLKPVESPTAYTFEEAIAEENAMIENEFEEGIPFPEPRRVQKYNFDKMRVGQSCFVPGRKAQNISSVLSNLNNAHGCYLVVRDVFQAGADGTSEHIGCRVWSRDPATKPVRKPIVRRAKKAQPEAAPAETAPAETAPAETAPAETAPAETAPAETEV